MNPKINMITLGTTNLESASKFYTSMGFKKSLASQDDVVFFKSDGLVLGLYPREKLAEDAIVSSKGRGFCGISISHNTKSEKEVDQVIIEAQKNGAKIVKKAQKVFWGGYSGYFSDPYGYLGEVAYNPFFKFDKDDNLILPLKR